MFLKNKFHRFLWLSFFCIFFVSVSAQDQEKQNTPKTQYLLVNLSYSIHTPGGDLKDRFGWSSTVGGGVEYISKRNLILGVNYDFIFGNNVEEDVLANLRTSEGNLVGNNSALSTTKLVQRGMNAYGYIGKLFPFKKSKPKSGIRAIIGAGILQHRIKIQQDPQSLVPQTIGTYEAGYDRLSNGIGFTEFIGYQKISANRTINFILGVELIQGLTQSKRSFDFDKMARDDTKRFDFLIGGKFAWTIPFELNKTGEDIFY